MNIYIHPLHIEGAELLGENPLPRFSDSIQDRPLCDDGKFTEEERKNHGLYRGRRFIPYRVQDRYTRDRAPIYMRTIVIENDCLRASFLADYGARLYSLFDKKRGEEILYSNPVMQLANLAKLNAWFSGGVEFNTGHNGHTAFTCMPLFAGEVTDADGERFLRFYEFDRITGAYYQMDFHLPDGANTLRMFVRIYNNTPDTMPLRWWSNIAVRQTENCRVFAGTKRVLNALYRPPDAPDSMPCFSADEMPFISTVPGDCSYSARIPFAYEFFFQYPADAAAPWEAVAYDDGTFSFEASTIGLRYRKMFTWGCGKGGRRWQEHLTAPGAGDYLEIQSGLTPTQSHGAQLPPYGTCEFTQVFGGGTAEGAKWTEGDWWDAAQDLQGKVYAMMPPEEINACHERYRKSADRPAAIQLCIGSAWGALEALRLEKQGGSAPAQLQFPASAISIEAMPWLSLLQDGVLRETSADVLPASFMLGDAWLDMLEKSILQPGGRNWLSLLHLGIMYREAGRTNEAVECWEDSISLAPSAIAHRNIAVILTERGEYEGALDRMRMALALMPADVSFAEETLSLMVLTKRYQAAWEYYQTLPEEKQASDRVRVLIAKCAVNLGHDDYLEQFFTWDFATLMEGDTPLTDLWFEHQARLKAKAEHIPYDEALFKEAQEALTPPYKLDYRMR